MSKSLLVAWAICIAASVAVLFMWGSRAASARADAASARRDLTLAIEQASELARLRQAKREFPERSEGGLASKVSAALLRAGLTASTLQSLSPEANTPVNGEPRLSRQRATLTLQGLSLPQVGAFLDAWRGEEPDWVVAGIDLSPASGRDAGSIGSDLPLRVSLTIEGLFKKSFGGPR